MNMEFIYAFVFAAMACGLALKLRGHTKKHLNSDGYIVLNSSKELEDRQIAKQLIGHETFQGWQRSKKENSGYYLTIDGKNSKKEVQLSNDHKSSLYKILKEERKRIAIERNIKIYMVFNNQTLYEISQKLPNSYESMLEIKGVGPVKMRMYGDEILNIVSDFKKSLGYEQKGRRDIA